MHERIRSRNNRFIDPSIITRRIANFILIPNIPEGYEEVKIPIALVRLFPRNEAVCFYKYSV